MNADERGGEREGGRVKKERKKDEEQEGGREKERR